MDMTGEYRIAAARDTVWAALNDPDVLRQCIPGCEEVEKVSDTEFTAKVKLKIGPVNARFAGRVNMTDIDPPNGYTISGEGQGGAAGFGKGGAKVNLVDDGPDATLLTYTAQAQVGGKLAQIGSRLVQSTAKKLADEFFDCFARTVGGEPAAQPSAAVPDAADPMLHTTDPDADGMTVPPAARPAEPVVPAPAAPAATIPGEIPTPAATGGNAAPGEPPGPAHADYARPAHSGGERLGQNAADLAPAAAEERRGGIGPLVWIPVLVLILAIALWAFS